MRLDDLQPGYAFGQLDRSIIMNPNQVNSRIVLPVTTYEHVMKGYPVDMVLYANNSEEEGRRSADAPPAIPLKEIAAPADNDIKRPSKHGRTLARGGA